MKRRELGFSQHDFDLSRRGSLHSHGSMHGYTTHANTHRRKIMTIPKENSTHLHRAGTAENEPLPLGTHNIDPSKALAPQGQGLFAEFVLNSKGLLTAKTLQALGEIDVKKEKSNDPAVRLAFTSKLDSETRSILDRQVHKPSVVTLMTHIITRPLPFPSLHSLLSGDRAAVL
jgi:CDGSH-type Zn-finger protein